LLVVVDGETGECHAGAAGGTRAKTENAGVELARLIKVGRIETDVRDTRDGRARRLLLRGKWKANAT
jgi:hypothetical protein